MFEVTSASGLATERGSASGSGVITALWMILSFVVVPWLVVALAVYGLWHVFT